MYYIDKDLDYIVHKTCVRITRWGGLFGLIVHGDRALSEFCLIDPNLDCNGFGTKRNTLSDYVDI